MRNAFLLILSLLTLSAQQLPDGKTLLDGESKALQSYVSYQYTEETSTQMAAAGMSIVMTMQVQAITPNKSRMEMKGSRCSSIWRLPSGSIR